MSIRERIESVLEYGLSGLFIWGGINTIISEPLLLHGPLGILVGQYAFYFYAVFFTGIGVLLAYSKIRKHKHLHKHMLLTMYLTIIYAIVLGLAISGITVSTLLGQVPNTLLLGLNAYLWLRWKFRTEYIDPNEFRPIDPEDFYPNGT